MLHRNMKHACRIKFRAVTDCTLLNKNNNNNNNNQKENYY